jgi:class 3 adenylate cyclase
MADSKPRLLIVDDDDNNVYTLERRLKQYLDPAIVVARNGREALAALAAQSFDLVLLDVQMPEIDGFEVLARMKADMALRDIPVIMISANDEFENVLRCIKLGADDYVGKPVNGELLRARVEASLERKRLRDQEAAHLAALEAEKRRADALLYGLLPRSIARELKSKNEIVPRRYDNVAVLFCDIVEFTPYCDRTAPEKVVRELQALVAAFEGEAERHGLEKIKTIGDAFMATAGLLNDVENAALAAAECGLALVAAAQRLEPRWRVRIGIHQGPVVAGIMGKQYFMFDLWGDTVNVAARVTELAEPDSVVVTAATWMNLRAAGLGRSVGLIELKGKGKVELVRYLGRKD